MTSWAARRRTGTIGPGLVGPGLAIGLLLTGCSLGSGDLGSTSVDLERAERAWSDPWFAPVETAVPTFAYGSNGQVDRTVGTRATTYPGSVDDALALEVAAATDSGWTVVSSRCTGERAVAQLVRGEALDDAVLAEVVVEPAGSGARTTVSGQVPHHADGSWPTPDPVDGTCVDGGPATDPVVLPDAPTDGDGAVEGAGGVGWDRDEPDADETALLDDLAADPWVASLDGVDLAYPTLRTGDNRRTVSPGTGELPRTDVPTVVDDMTAGGGWEPVWAACTSGTTDVRLRQVTEHGVAVVRLLSDAATGGAVAWELAVSAPEAPVVGSVTEAPALVDSPCLDPGVDDLPDGLTVTGTPVALLTRLQPIAE